MGGRVFPQLLCPDCRGESLVGCANCDTEQDTPSQSRSQSRIRRAMPFPPMNSNATTVTVLAATAAFSSQSYSKPITAGTLHNEQFGTGKPYVICQDTTRQDTSHEATFPGQARGQARVTPTSNRLQPSLYAVTQYGCLRLTPHHKTSRPARSCSWGVVEYVAEHTSFHPGPQESDDETEPMSHNDPSFSSHRTQGNKENR